MNISAILAEAKLKSPQASAEEIRAVNLARLEAVAQVQRRGRR